MNSAIKVTEKAVNWLLRMFIVLLTLSTVLEQIKYSESFVGSFLAFIVLVENCFSGHIARLPE